MDLILRADERVRHLEEAAGEALGRGVADVAGVVDVVEADAEDALGVAVQRGVDDLVIGNHTGNALAFGLAAGVVPVGQALELAGLNQGKHALAPGRTLCRVDRLDGQDALLGDDAGDLGAAEFDGG